MKFAGKIGILLLFFVTALLSGCTGNDKEEFGTVSDIHDKRIGVLKSASFHDDIKILFPDAEVKQHDKMLNLMFELSAGKLDVVALDEKNASAAVLQNPDFAILGDTIAGNAVVQVVAPADMIIHIELEAAGKRWIDRIKRNFVESNGWQLIIKGLRNTVVMFIFGAVLAILIGAFLAYLMLSHKWTWFSKPLSWLVLTLHDVPSVVLMMLFYYVIFASVNVNGIVVAIIALGVYSSGSLFKIFKVHISQVNVEQRESARVLGLTPYQTYRYVVLPQAVKSMLPLFIAELKVLLRATSYAGYIAQKDLIKMSEAIRTQTYDALLPLLTVTLLYLLLSWLIEKGVDLCYKKFFVYD